MTMTKSAVPVLRFRPTEDGLYRWLGPTEAKIMEIFWEKGPSLTVKRVHRMIQENYAHDVAYTTVMTTMTRLFEKGVLSRVKNGLSYFYTVKCSLIEFEDRQILAIVESIGIDVLAQVTQQGAR